MLYLVSTKISPLDISSVAAPNEMTPLIRTVDKELTIDIRIGKCGIEVLGNSAATDEISGREIGKNENEQIIR